MPAVAELFTAFADHIVVGIRRQRPGRDAQALFHFFEPGRHFGAAVAFDRIFAGPMREGSVRGAKAGGPVDQGGTAHRPALQDGDSAVLAHAADAFLVKAGVGFVFQQLEITTGLERAFFDQQHFVAGGAEDFGGGTAPGAAADDGDIRFQGQVVIQGGAIVGFPATGQAVAEQIGYGHRCALLFLSEDAILGDCPG